MIEKDVLAGNLKDLLKEKKFKDILIEGLKLLKPSKFRIIFIIIVLLLICVPVYNIVNGADVIKKVQFIMDESNDLIKDLFGIIFTGYALFQALIGVNALKQMLINKIGKHSSFKAYNLYFFILSIMYLVLIIFNYILGILINSGIYNYISILNVTTKKCLEFSFIIVYIGINIFAISEIKSFLVNMYHCFNMSVFSEGIEIVNNHKDK